MLSHAHVTLWSGQYLTSLRTYSYFHFPFEEFDEFELIEDFRISTKETTQHALDTFVLENKSNTDETDADVVLSVESASTDTRQQQNEISWGPKIYMTENHPLKLMVYL